MKPTRPYSDIVLDTVDEKLKSMKDLLLEVEWCSDDIFPRFEKNALQTIKLIQQEPLLQKVFGWDKSPLYYEHKPDEKNILTPKKYKRNLGRDKAIEYCRDIHEKLHDIEGIFTGKNTQFRFWVVMKVWVFGSVAKGKNDANDLDLLYSYQPVSFRTNHGVDVNNIEDQFLKYVLKGKRQTTLMDYDDHNCFATGKIEIYPKFKLK